MYADSFDILSPTFRKDYSWDHWIGKATLDWLRITAKFQIFHYKLFATAKKFEREQRERFICQFSWHKTKLHGAEPLGVRYKYFGYEDVPLQRMPVGFVTPCGYLYFKLLICVTDL